MGGGSKLLSVFGLSVTLGLAGAMAVHAQDDWKAVRHNTIENRDDSNIASAPIASAPKMPSQHSSTDPSKRATVACGEEVLPAKPRFEAMVSRINELWGSNVRVYQTIAPEMPHAAPDGCVFYNTAAMVALMTYRLDVDDANVVDPLLWGIFAHEVGHEVHEDFSEARASVPIETRELEADRFAGYTLEKLDVRVTDLTPYWTLTGDEFGAATANDKHGSSAKRVAAFKEGWHLAEWDRPENSASVYSAMDDPVAPDNPDSAPR